MALDPKKDFPPKSPKKSTTFRLSEKTLRQLTELSEDYKQSRTAVVQKLIDREHCEVFEQD